MRDFDKLSPRVRRVLANCDHNWSGSEVLIAAQWRDDNDVIRLLKKNDIGKHQNDAEKDPYICGGQR